MENTTDKIETEKDLDFLIHENYILAETLHQITFSHDREDEINEERDSMIADAKSKLNRTIKEKELFTVSFEII